LRGVACRRQRGFSLIALASILALLSALIVALGYKTSDYFNQSQALDAEALMRVADHQLRQYVLVNGRLPCPDTDGDGLSNGGTANDCNGTQKGNLPYKTLGLTDRHYRFGEVPILYGVYNTNLTSFTSSAHTFFPSYENESGDLTRLTLPAAPSTFDFCASLGLLQAQGLPAASSAGLAVTDGTNTYNAVYALALPGLADRDAAAAGWPGTTGISPQYDGLNAVSATRFELPQRPVTAQYDDRTLFRSAQSLHDLYRCESMLNAIDILSTAVTTEKQTRDFAAAMASQVKMGLIMNAMSSLQATVAVINAGRAVAAGGEVIGVSSSLLATAAATCPLPPWITCALIPIFSAALASGISGSGLAAASLVTASAALALRLTAVGLYAALLSRTTDPSAPPDTAATPPSVADQMTALTSYAAAKATARTAYSDLTAYGPAVTPAIIATDKADRDSKLAAANANVASVVDATLKSALTVDLNGSTATCTPPALSNCAGYTARQVPRTNGSGALVTNPDGSEIYDTIYTKDLVPAPYSPGVAPSVAGYYQAVAQAGATQAPTPIPAGADATTTAAITAANAKQAAAAAAAVPPATALANSNVVIGSYSNLLASINDFDTKNLTYNAAETAYTAAQAAAATAQAAAATALAAYVAAPTTPAATKAALLLASNNAAAASTAADGASLAAKAARDTAKTARDTARGTVRTGIGNATWDYTGSATVCGGGSTTASSCGWMTNATAGGGGATVATTGSAAVNAFLASEAIYQNALGWQKVKDAAAAKADAAWTSRNELKMLLCAAKAPPVSFIGGGRSSDDPLSWDVTENVLATDGSGAPTPVNLNCIGLSQPALPTDVTGANNVTLADRRLKYCTVGGLDYNAAICAALNLPTTATSVQGVEPIVNSLIDKGIAR
jgi:hypothetical protein